MTLKEQTIKRIEQQKEKIEKHQKEYGRVSLYDKLELKYLENVLKSLELLEILKKIVLGVGTEEDLAAVIKHFEMEVKQVLEKSHEGYTVIQYPQEKDNGSNNK